MRILFCFMISACLYPIKTNKASTIEREVFYQLKTDNYLPSVHIDLKGTEYSVSSKCRIMKENQAETNFEDIQFCPNNEKGVYDKCVKVCTARDINLSFFVLSPRSKYIYIKDGNDVMDELHKQGGKVYGFSIPLMVDPSIDASTHFGDKLMLKAITCNPVACPIYYKSVKYKDVPPANYCITPYEDNNDQYATSVEYGIKVPYFEVRCIGYPIFYYHMPNDYMRNEIDIYRPQFYVKRKNSNENSKYYLSFNNAFSSEICLFKIRDGADSSNPPTYSSQCGNNNNPCVAPCNDIELTLDSAKPIVEILIQTRYHQLELNDNGYIEGYGYKKYVITEPNEEENSLISSISNTGVKLNVKLFSPPSASVAFYQCKVKYYAAGTPKDHNKIVPKCSNGAKCNENCNEVLNIQDLPAGQSIMFEIDPGRISGFDDFKEYLYVRTKKKNDSNFNSAKVTPKETTALVKAIEGNPTSNANEPVCDYYVSRAGIEQFFEAKCEDSNPCRGLCKDPKTVIDLEPNTAYDIKVVSYVVYGSFIYKNIQTTFSTLNLAMDKVQNGFRVKGTLSTPYNNAKCEYKINVKNGQAWENVYSCVISAPKATSTLKLESFSRNKIRRAGTQQNNRASTKTCHELSNCNNIIFNEGYDASKEYQVLATAIGRSQEVSIIIPSEPTPATPTTPVTPPEPSKKIIVSIVRDGKTLRVTTALPEGKDKESKCKWSLLNSNEISRPTVKRCMGMTGDSCEVLPSCKSFTIENVDDVTDYQLTVSHSEDDTVVGLAKIKKGSTGSKSKSNKTIIIVVSVIVAIVLVGGITGFIFYWKINN